MNTVSENELVSLKRFLIECCAPPQCSEIEEGERQEHSRRHHTQEIDCMLLLHHCPSMGQLLFTKTYTLIKLLTDACVELCRDGDRLITEQELSVRFTHVPSLMTTCVLPSILPPEGQLVQVCGSIVRMTAKKVVPHSYRLMCPKCREVTVEYTSPFSRDEKVKGKCSKTSCKHEELQIVGQTWMDYAECRLQQRSNQTGKLPRSIDVTLDDELGSKCSVGQFVEVIGILHNKWKRVFPLSSPSIEPTIAALNILPMDAYRGASLTIGSGPRRTMGKVSAADVPKFTPEGFFIQHPDKMVRNAKLCNSVCPQLAGLFAPRMSILLSAVGGSTFSSVKGGMHIRSTIHCLYVGDPSTGKTQLLRFAAAIAPRSTSTTGMGSTSAGLTVAATKEHGEWVLEPGALVLSDGGSCIIDELRTVSSADRASLHEAMEQQTISVAKGGIVTKLRTVCSVLSACNPPKRRNGQTEIGVGAPLLSRFDFIFLLWDIPQSTIDEKIAEHILAYNTVEDNLEPTLSEEDVARYLWWVRSQYAHVEGPLLTDSAAKILGKYYEIQRQRGTSGSLDDSVPITVRFLESLVRISQAHAKLHLQSTTTVGDAAMAIFLMERSAFSLKIPLFSIEPDLYSSSRILDDVFLSCEPDHIAMQDHILQELIHIVLNYSAYASESSSNDDVTLSEKTSNLLLKRKNITFPTSESIKKLSQQIYSPDKRSQVVYTSLVALQEEKEFQEYVAHQCQLSLACINSQATCASQAPGAPIIISTDDQVLLSSQSVEQCSSGNPSLNPAEPPKPTNRETSIETRHSGDRKRPRTAEELLQSLKSGFSMN